MLSSNSKSRKRNLEQDRLSNSSYSSYKHSMDPDIADTADSSKRWRTEMPCDIWKSNFDAAMNFYLDTLVDKFNSYPTQTKERFKNHPNRDKLLIEFIRKSKFEIKLSNILLQLFAVHNEDCLKYIINDYTDFFKNNFNESLEDKCYSVSLKIFFDKFKKRL
jgi:hypothetical protein